MDMNVDEYVLMTMMMMNSIENRRMGMTKMYCCDSGYRVTWGGQEERGSYHNEM